MNPSFILLSHLFAAVADKQHQRDDCYQYRNAYADVAQHVRLLLRGLYNRQIKKFPTEKQNVSLKHILT